MQITTKRLIWIVASVGFQKKNFLLIARYESVELSTQIFGRLASSMFCKKHFKSWHLWITGSYSHFPSAMFDSVIVLSDHNRAINSEGLLFEAIAYCFTNYDWGSYGVCKWDLWSDNRDHTLEFSKLEQSGWLHYLGWWKSSFLM